MVEITLRGAWTVTLLGVWCQARLGMNVLEDGPVPVAFFVVTYPPGILIYVGLLQMINGIWGIARARGYLQIKNNIYQVSLGFQWINVLVLQDIVQLSYSSWGMLAPVAPTLAAWTVGLSPMPAYLDHKMSTLPETFPDDYYKATVFPISSIEVCKGSKTTV